ncbi:hypothetical protein JCM10212_006204 [Sporobolomyces blumeae]
MSSELSPEERLQRDFPQLDPALVYAILSDFTSPLSQHDEHAARATLDSLASSAEVEGEAADRQAAAYNADDDQRQSSRGQTSTSVSELSSALEGSNLDDGQLAENDDIASRTGSATRSAAGQRFWDESATSTTSDEGNPSPSPTSRDKSPLGTHARETGHTVDPFDFDESLTGFDDPLAFLASVFPDVDISVLESKIASARAQSSTSAPLPVHDLESLIEDLLSQDLITSLIDDDSHAAQLANPPPDFAAEARAALSKTQKRRLKQAQKAKNSFSLTSTPTTPSGNETDPIALAGGEGASASALFSAPSTSNAWASATSHASYLSSLLHVPTTRISSLYYQNSASLPLTLAVLMKQLSAERPFDSLPFSSELKDQFRLVLPRTTSDDEIKVLLSATNGDLSDAIDLKRFVADLENAQGKVLAYNEMVMPFDPAASVVAGDGAGRHARNGSADSTGSFTQVLTHRGAPLGTPSSSAPPTNPAGRPYTAEECYAMSSEYLEKRNNAFRTAARSFQRGGIGERGAAGYWAEVGRDFERERRKWDERGAKAVVSERRARHDPFTVDLHGLTLSHSLKIVEESVNAWWANARESASPHPLRIVTGIGRHSKNQTPVLLPAVTKHLDKHGWRWKWDDSPYVVGGLGPVREARGAVRVLGVK